jgi:uncharacterized protein YyaL (SSP411 family)/aryl-alcohol dehydrogenase-like predicted oxidoreductase
MGDSKAEHTHTNALVDETSPYLLQHAHNPVDWYPWGSAAIARAKEEDKPIMLSIGYAACHWCHVMERESFENEDTAALMNEHFVCIKVDREERPDIDEIYMAATVAMSGSGGWPMTVFLSPDDHAPFFAGTYFPPEDMHGRPGFPTLLKRIADLWKSERSTLDQQGRELVEQLARQAKPALAANVGEGAIDKAVAMLSRQFDPTYGGFGPAPKFPPSMVIELLLRHYRRTGEDQSLVMARRTLDGMARGGMYDQLGGGFARYSTDERWLVPHFEKMLYDNALLVRVYAFAYQVMQQPDDARIVRETLDYILREMCADSGVFYSATDADSEGVEGKFFVWTPEEIEAVLPAEQAKAFCAYYDVTPQGNWEGHSILQTRSSMDDVASELGVDAATLAVLLEKAKTKLYAARSERVPPMTDDKILTAWNALMISTLAECGRILDEPRYRDAAARAASWIWENMRREDGGLFRTTRANKTHLDAYLEDYAYLSDALVDVYEATGDAAHLERAIVLAERAIADFHDADAGAFFNTAVQHEKLVLRTREGQDGAIPSANAVMARALVRLSQHSGRESWRSLAVEAIRAHGKLIERAPRAFATSLCVVDMLLEGPVEAVLVGESSELRAALGKPFLPNRIIVHHQPGRDSVAPDALVAGKDLIEGAPALYVCRNFVCKRPVTAAKDVTTALDDERTTAIASRDRRLGERLAGAASAEGTARRAKRFEDGTHCELGNTSLLASRIGFGGYRVDDQEKAFADALRKALVGGCNLIDTSTNYTDGGSERLVGAVITELIAAGELARDEVIVVSKIGYAQASNFELAERRKQEGKAFDEMVEYSDGCWHCIHPDWLEDQLERSLDRLGLGTLDVCLLHNPEYFFTDAAKRGEVDDDVRAAFYQRLERAFVYFEAQVKAGRIGCYGVSSNSVAQSLDDPEATQLDRMLAAARNAGGDDHHFRILQMPINLIESEGVLDDVVDGGTVLAYAQAHGVAVFANRPLNAILSDGIVRLADTPAAQQGTPPRSFDEQIQRLRALEKRFSSEIGVGDLFNWSEQLTQLDRALSSVSQLEHVARGQIIPMITRAIKAVEQRLPAEKRTAWTGWRAQYIREVEATLAVVRAQITEKARRIVAKFSEAMDPSLPLSRHNEPLSRKVLWLLMSTPGLDVVLLGMRREPYVDDALPVMAWDALGRWQGAYRSARIAAKLLKI